jgi:uncharacterized protein (DUF1501 family)
MLTVADAGSRIDRRGFLTAGSLGLGGLCLPDLLAAAERQPGAVTGKSVIFLFQQGGPSQFETFDPKPDAIENIRTVDGTIPTSVPGIRFGSTMPQLAQVADKLTIVRSFQTNNAGHNIQPLVSRDTADAFIGSLISYVIGPVHPSSGVPTNTVLFPQAVRDDVKKGAARGDLSATGKLGAIHAPFIPGSGGPLQKNMRLNLARDRFEDRRALLAAFDRLQRDFDSSVAARDLGDVRERALGMLLSNRVAEAFDLSREDAATLARYDTSGFASPDGWSRANRGRLGYYDGQAKSVGRLLLLARRLCEAGCGFVTVHADYEGVWDMHADGNNLNMLDGMQAVGKPFDHAVAAFIEDVESRGLQDDILLVCCGEMGRTPKLNPKGGRDHWARLAPLMLYGGGLRDGQVIGSSTADGGEPATENLTPQHLISTILRTAFDIGHLRLIPQMAAVTQLGEHPPIPGLG